MLAERASVDAPATRDRAGDHRGPARRALGQEKRLVQDAAVVGKVFWRGAVAAIEGAERGRAEELLHALERKEFVQRAQGSSVAGETEYAFRHVLVRDVAYGQIPRAARAEKHERPPPGSNLCRVRTTRPRLWPTTTAGPRARPSNRE